MTHSREQLIRSPNHIPNLPNGRPNYNEYKRIVYDSFDYDSPHGRFSLEPGNHSPMHGYPHPTQTTGTSHNVGHYINAPPSGPSTTHGINGQSGPPPPNLSNINTQSHRINNQKTTNYISTNKISNQSHLKPPPTTLNYNNKKNNNIINHNKSKNNDININTSGTKNNNNNNNNNKKISKKNSNMDKKSSKKQPTLSDLDKPFVNENGFKRYQKWERFNEAKLWLPGEKTTFVNNGFRYVIGEPINIGINGHIYYCYRWRVKTGGNYYINYRRLIENLCVKIVPNRDDYSREFKIIKKLQSKKNKNIINLMEVIHSSKIIFGIMELAKMDAHQFFVRNGLKRYNLTEKTFIKNKINKTYINLRKPGIRENFARKIMYDIINALYDIKKNKYIHFDIKIRNILIFFNNNLKLFELSNWNIKSKLCDFGHSFYGEYKISSISNSGNVNLGTHGHIAPELFVKNKKCNYKVDIWSLGITLLMILCPGYYIFDKYTTLDELNKKYNNINNKNIKLRLKSIPPWWSEYQTLSPESRDLILWLTRYNPIQRPNYNQILNHPWFKMVNNNSGKLYKPKLPYYNEYCQNSKYSMIAQE